MAITAALASAALQLPEQLRTGLARLAADGLYFAPVRHHSPACALALQALIREVRPAAVLIEGPDSFDALLPLLLDQGTRPPVAIFAQAPQAPATPAAQDAQDAEEDAPPTGRAGLRSVFFPFCDYSPEWVALREGHAAGAQLAFIDLPWHTVPERADAGDEARTLMSERYLAHSGYLKALATRSGCRDQDELWDRLFELRPAAQLRDWRTLFADVFSYCAMARIEYEDAVLEADGSLARERHMAAHIRHWRAQAAGPIVVVSGGFHTLALQQMLECAAPSAQAAAIAKARARSAATLQNQAGNWLIRYSFDRLDALNGYAAGMPSPAWYQRVWDSANAHDDGPALRQVAADCLTALARQSRALGLSEQISSADVLSATLQACRLAELRGHAGPGRQDLLDAIRSCFIKGAIDDGANGLAQDIRALFSGSLLGDVPPSAGSPPLLEDARRLARSMRIHLDDSQPRTVKLDLYRKQAHRERSRFLHLMSYLDTTLARCQSGPDFMAASALELLNEEWSVAWNPLVEARLIELAPAGATLADAAMARLRKEEAALDAQGGARSAASAVQLLTRACVIGLHQRLPVLLDTLASHLAEDASALSVIHCGHRLLVLWRAREPLGVQRHPQLRTLLLQAWDAAMYLLPQLAGVSEDQEQAAIGSLLALRALHHALHPMLAPGAAQRWPAQLEAIAAMQTTQAGAPGVGSAAAALLFIDGHWNDAALAAMLGAQFGPGATPAQAVRALTGLMTAAPELLLTQAALRRDLNAIIASWDEQTFLAYLPELRLAFALLKPRETASLAEALAGMAEGAAAPQAALAETHYAVSEADMLAGAALQAALGACLERDGLAAWRSLPAAEAAA